MPEKELYYDDGKIRMSAVVDAHVPYEVHRLVESDERETLANNERIRSERLLEQDSPSKLVEGDVIAFAFQFPTMFELNLVRAAEPELVERAMRGMEGDNIRAAERLAILYPQYVTTTRRGDARRRP